MRTVLFAIALLAASLLPAPAAAAAVAAAATPPAGSLAAPITSVAPSDLRSALWLPPLGAPLRVTEPFDLPNGPYQAGHRGIDLPADAGETLRSPTGGTVTFVGTVVDRPLISIRVDARTLLSLEPVDSNLSEGDIVTPGQVLGTVATGGHCATECMHLGVRVNGYYVNPLRFFYEKPVLLPW